MNEQKVTRGLAWLDNRAAERQAEMARTRRARRFSIGCAVLGWIVAAVVLVAAWRWATTPAAGVSPW